MLKYAKLNADGLTYSVGIGTDEEYYKSIGMKLTEVERAYNGSWYAKGNAPAKPAPTEEEIQKMLTDGVQAYMDTKAQERGYDNIHTACSYVNSTDKVFRAEGTACVAWRDAVWRKCYSLLAEVKAGTRSIPTLEKVIAELPKLVWQEEQWN